MILPCDANPGPDGIFGKDSRVADRASQSGEASCAETSVVMPDRRPRVPTLFRLRFRFLLLSGFGRLAAFHMSELFFSQPFQLGIVLFEFGFLLTKVGL
jgi:hypothetical protein